MFIIKEQTYYGKEICKENLCRWFKNADHNVFAFDEREKAFVFSTRNEAEKMLTEIDTRAKKIGIHATFEIIETNE